MKAWLFTWIGPLWRALVVALLLSGFGGAGRVHAAPEAGGAAPSFRVLGYGDSRFEGIFVRTDDQEDEALVELAFQPNRRSRSYVLPDGAEIEFVTKSIDERGRERLNLVARARSVAGAEQLLFLFITKADAFGATEDLPYQVVTLDESPSAFGPGDVRLINLTGAILKGQLGASVFEAEPGVSPILRLPLDSETPQPMRFAVAYQDSWRIVHSTMTRADRRYGALLALKPPVDPDSLRLRVERIW